MRATLSDAGIPQAVASYDAWGMPETPLIDSFGFTGELQQGRDVWLRARWYGAGRGSFGSRDAFAGWERFPASHHPFAYALNDPVNNIDPTGKCVPWVQPNCYPIWELNQGVNLADGRTYVDAVLIEPAVGMVTSITVLIDDPGVVLRGAHYLANHPVDSALAIGQATIAPFTNICEGTKNRDPNQVGRGLTGIAVMLAGAKFARTPRAAPLAQATPAEGAVVGRSIIAITRARILQVAGFRERALPIIVDESVEISIPGTTAALRARGYNVRSVQEIYRVGRVQDPTILDLAESIDGRVLTMDRGHDIGGGFGRRSITVKGRIRNIETVLRILELEIGGP